MAWATFATSEPRIAICTLTYSNRGIEVRMASPPPGRGIAGAHWMGLGG